MNNKYFKIFLSFFHNFLSKCLTYIIKTKDQIKNKIMNRITNIRNNYNSTKDEWKLLPSRTKLSMKMLFVAGMVMFGSTMYLSSSPIHHEYNFDLTVHDVNDKSVVYDANIVMSSTIFAVDTPINVSATVRTLQGSTPTDYVYLLFDGSHSYPHEKIQKKFGERLYGGKIDAQKQSDGWYVGNTELDYQMDGCYDVRISDRPIDTFESLNQSRTCNLIHIASSEATNMDFYNKWLVAISLGSISLSFVAIISVFRDVLGEVEENEKNYKKQRAESKNTKNCDDAE